MDEDDTVAVNPRDRMLYVAVSAVSGVGIGASVIVASLVGGQGGAVASVAIWLVLLATVLWVEKNARTAPEQFSRWTRIGFGTSVLLYLAAAMPWLGSRDEVGWGLLLAAALVVAVPCLIAGARIARRHD